MKAKLGISVGLLGAALYFSGLFSGYIVLTLLAGYTLIFEENLWLRQTAVKAFAICIGFSILSTLIGLIPDAIELVNSIFRIFEGTFSLTVVSGIVLVVRNILSICETVLLLCLGFKALHQGTIKIDIIDRLISNNMSSN